MRKKILAAVLAATMPEVIGVSGKRSVEKIDNTSNNVEEVKIEEVKIEETMEEVVVVENVVEEPINTEPIEEEKSKYTYEFEGKYWLRYSEYGHKGLYFDGTQVISKIENGGTFSRDYYVEDDVIYIGEPFYRYEIKDGKLGLAFVRDDMGNFSYYEEVEKMEYESIFREYTR